MTMRILGVVVAASALFLVACPRPPPPLPPVPPTPTAFRVPPGCGGDLSGVYSYAGREDWRYAAQDQGGTLTLRLDRTVATDGGAVSDGGVASASVAISLARSASGFSGAISHTVFPAPGAQCVVAFPTEVVGCDADGMTLASAETLDVDQSCGSPPDAGFVRKTHRLVRVVAAPAVVPTSVPTSTDGGS